MPNRIGITGAPGCGVTTLGRALAARLDAVHIDTDEYHWVATDPPYREKRDVPARLAGMKAAQERSGRWVVSGTLEAWAEGVVAEAELIVFLEVPTKIRLARLRARESERFGDALLPGGNMHETHREFIAWAAEYEHGSQPGRSRPRHERWLAGLTKPVLRLDGIRPVAELVAAVMRHGDSQGTVT